MIKNKNMIPMVNLQAQYAEIKAEIESGIAKIMSQCVFVLGPNVQAFEKEVATYLGVKHALGCASGTDALCLALQAIGITAGDEVITSAFTFIATAEAIKYVGATPVFVDIDKQTFNIIPKTIEPAITNKTKAIMPVHLFGQPADIKEIKLLCQQHNLKLLEDCAQSFGAAINGKKTGTFSHAAGFSFFPSKNLGAFGDAGLVTTNCSETAKKLRLLHNHGSTQRYKHEIIGCNSRLDEIQALVLRVKLKRIEQYNKARCLVAHRYSKLMRDLPLTIPYEDGVGQHVYHQYTVLCERRDEIMQALQKKQIACAIYYPVPLHKQHVFATEYADVFLPVTDYVAQRCLSLPMCPSLTADSVKDIVTVIKNVLS